MVSFYRAAGDGLRLRLKVRPQARRAAIDGVVPDIEGEALAVSVTAPPEDGKANAAVVALLARAWKLPAASFAVVQGATARRKLVSITGDPGTLAAIIEAWRSSRA
ncbi:DUF167 domain-containing protein [Vineibacter terrae]|uniref:UPF0235 protein FHP25_13210 n=1 Tax=Vineibacter terrae TaxID=2586908 RepID=A0A5C8PNW4_9HYPH|nr:DUF167 domain-containing protein [Vineibacter terrae]